MTRFTISLIIVGFMCARLCNAEVDPGSIVGAWLFDETGGKVAKDSSDNGNDGDLVGGAKWVKGKFGNAIELNGKDAWVTVPEIGPLDDFTLMKWFNATGRVGLWRCFFNRDGWAPGFVHYQFRPDNKMEMAIHSNNPVRHPGWPNSDFTAGKASWINGSISQLPIAAPMNSFASTSMVNSMQRVNGDPYLGNFGPGRIGSWDGGGREWEGIVR